MEPVAVDLRFDYNETLLRIRSLNEGRLDAVSRRAPLPVFADVPTREASAVQGPPGWTRDFLQCPQEGN